MLEPPPPLIFEPHPLVALPRPVAPGTLDLPQAHGQAAVTGALSKTTLSTTAAIAEALFSNDDAAPPAERLRWLMDQYADFMSRTTGRSRLMFSAAAWTISVLAPLLNRRWPPFRNLSLLDRIDALRAFEASPLSAVLIALRAILCIIYYEHPDVARALGLPLTPKGDSRG